MTDHSTYLQHHGILGMKWGVRRYRNKDGTLTPQGKMRYNKTDVDDTYRKKKDWNRLSDSEFKAKYKTTKEKYLKEVRKKGDPIQYRNRGYREERRIRNTSYEKMGVKAVVGASGAILLSNLAASRYTDEGSQHTATLIRNVGVLAAGAIAFKGIGDMGSKAIYGMFDNAAAYRKAKDKDSKRKSGIKALAAAGVVAGALKLSFEPAPVFQLLSDVSDKSFESIKDLKSGVVDTTGDFVNYYIEG